MTKSKDGDKRSPVRDTGQIEVVDSAGQRRRFLRGMVTHELVQRGVAFDDAYEIAQTIRDGFGDRDEVSTLEIREAINQELIERFGPDLPAAMAVPSRAAPTVFVTYHGQRQPFSHGLLARSLHAAGVDVDRAYDLVLEIESGILAEGLTTVSSEDIARRADAVLECHIGERSAQRYRLLRRVRNLPRPLVMYIGGASGTGKSSLALELAPLLRIYRINATDTIRQVMRMVFTPNIMPALHTSSFETASDLFELTGIEERVGPLADPDYRERLIGSFEEQARRVCVGVRAVVERAISENMNVLVEGVHLLPGMVPFADLEGSAYQVPLALATLDEEAHRARFLARSRAAGRRAERYLENFGAIRVIHDHILQQAEDRDIQTLETSEGDVPVIKTLQLVTGMLENRLPSHATDARRGPGESVPSLLLIIDGLPDRPVRALGGRTPLQAADTPTLDRLAREGRSGLSDPIAPGVVPDTAAGSLALFGQSPRALNRGPLEALGAKIKLSQGDIALRANFATIDDAGQVVDRRAGRIRDDAQVLAKAIDKMSLPRSVSGDVEIRVKVGTEHRIAVVLRGEGLSGEVVGSDPGEGMVPSPYLTPRPKDPNDERAVHTARILAIYEQAVRDVLCEHPVNKEREAEGLPPANAILTRGAGRIHRLIPLEEAGLPLSLACISGDRTILGLAGWLGAKTIKGEGMTANLDTDLPAKFDAARKALKKHDLVVVHVKGADIAAHDRRPELKAAFLERVDAELGRLLRKHKGALRVAVGSDHATLSESGQHAADPLPVVIWGPGIEADGVERFDEQSAASGALERFPLQLLLGKLFDLS